ncbi:MAG TPA: GNAT family N-acetyltransferase [Acidimicrobiia bacterium]|nr:GNAT family N-acetyltransferase [Acidimicrobiia bacterium]
MKLDAAEASHSDIPTLEDLYQGLEEEMAALHPMWPLADGLPDPVDKSFGQAIEDEDTLVLLGRIDGYPFGFMLVRVEEMLNRARGERLAAIRLVYVDPEAREVGVGEVMLQTALERLRSRGISKFDAHVLPGHRLVKNFFEAGGFAARSIIMHHDDDKG